MILSPLNLCIDAVQGVIHDIIKTLPSLMSAQAL